MQTPSRRGRPPEADPARVVEVALSLFERKGFDRVTMDEVARASSVSRRTLFRLFPSKADLVWGGLKDVHEAVQLRATLSSEAPLQLSGIMDYLFAPILSQLDEPEAGRVARRRLRLIAGAPALLNHQLLREIERVITTALEASALEAGLPPALVARTLVATGFAALVWWAEHGENVSALEAARSAFKTVALADRS